MYIPWLLINKKRIFTFGLKKNINLKINNKKILTSIISQIKKAYMSAKRNISNSGQNNKKTKQI